jgi:flagellar motor switch protein FliN/FliY
MAMSQEDIDALLKNMPEHEQTGTEEKIPVAEPQFSEVEPSGAADTNAGQKFNPKLDLLYDLQLVLSIELGRTTMMIRDILRLSRGSVVEFDKLVSEPVDVLVNGRKIAEGEVVVIDKHFGIRITSLVDPSDRLRSLRR